MKHAIRRLDVLQAVNRQISLEQQLQTLRENEQALQTLQESLSQLDHTLTSYLTDRIDAFQLPQEAQVRSVIPEGLARKDLTIVDGSLLYHDLPNIELKHTIMHYYVTSLNTTIHLWVVHTCQ